MKLLLLACCYQEGPVLAWSPHPATPSACCPAICGAASIGRRAGFPRSLLVNGRMQGVWHHEIKGSRVEVAIEPFVKTPVWVRPAAGQEAERLAAFLGGALSLAWKS